jgi:glycosyltransferase involved in cell wall biosynthesis
MKSPCPVDFCVLIPCFNNPGGLLHSLLSIEYDRSKFAVLVIDDGSYEPVSPAGLYQILPAGFNISVLRNESNQGITKSLNRGLEYISRYIRPVFIARLDCGDICAPERFYRQVAFLKTNPDIDLTGTWCYFKDADSGAAFKYITPTLHKRIIRGMNFRNVFIHPTVMWRFAAMSAVKYPEQYPDAEDYGLFFDMISKSRSAIINEFLVTCEMNRKGISYRFRDRQLKSRSAVIKHYSKNGLYRFLGVLKLRLLMMLPYELVLQTKKTLYGADKQVYRKRLLKHISA